jgi:hypothetical protein
VEPPSRAAGASEAAHHPVNFCRVALGSEDARCARAGPLAAAAGFDADTTVLVVLGVPLALLAAVSARLCAGLDHRPH